MEHFVLELSEDHGKLLKKIINVERVELASIFVLVFNLTLHQECEWTWKID